LNSIKKKELFNKFKKNWKMQKKEKLSSKKKILKNSMKKSNYYAMINKNM